MPVGPDIATADSLVLSADGTNWYADGTWEWGTFTYLQLSEMAPGAVKLTWPSASTPPPDTYSVMQNGVAVQTVTFAAGSATIPGLAADTAYKFKIVSTSGGSTTFQSNEVSYQYDSRKTMTVTPMRRPFPFPSTGLYLGY